MATIRIRYNGGDVPVVTGDKPPDDATPIEDPTATGFKANHPFIVVEGLYCFGLDTAEPHAPLWRIVQAVDGQEAELVFRTLP